ncbi:MAG: hypothetical protein OXC09_11580 [Truepera sp.]|nr:hypothetical protein [Truepera sp.]
MRGITVAGGLLILSIIGFFSFLIAGAAWANALEGGTVFQEMAVGLFGLIGVVCVAVWVIVLKLEQVARRLETTAVGPGENVLE